MCVCVCVCASVCVCYFTTVLVCIPACVCVCVFTYWSCSKMAFLKLVVDTHYNVVQSLKKHTLHQMTTVLCNNTSLAKCGF